MKKSKVAILILGIAFIVGILYFMFILNSNKVTIDKTQQIGQQITSGFTTQATVRLNDITAVMDINKTSPQKLTFNIVEPTVLKDFLFDYNGENIDISYKGLGLSLSKDNIIAQSMVNVLISAINSATQPEGLEFALQDGSLLASGKDENGEFNLKLDENTGNFLSLSYPQIDLECTFDNFVFAPPTSSDNTDNTNNTDNIDNNSDTIEVE